MHSYSPNELSNNLKRIAKKRKSYLKEEGKHKNFKNSKQKKPAVVIKPKPIQSKSSNNSTGGITSDTPVEDVYTVKLRELEKDIEEKGKTLENSKKVLESATLAHKKAMNYPPLNRRFRGGFLC